MRTKNQKYRRSHWWKFTDWENIFHIALIAITVVCFFTIIVYAAFTSEKRRESAKQTTDSIHDSTQADSIPKETKSDPAVFDSTISSTRVVVGASRPVKIVVK